MHEYAAFGAQLSSALPFPELERWRPPGVDGLRWRLEVVHAPAPPPPAHGSELLGEADYAGEGGAHMTLHRGEDSWQLGTNDAGTWQLNPAEGWMCWFRGPDAREAVARFDALGRVMPLMLHATGHVSLHGAGIADDDGGIVIVGPKGRGKSSLALACVEAGARLAGDDVSIIRPGVEPMLQPGVPFVRLRMDSARALERAAPNEELSGGSKLLVPPNEIERPLRTPVMLRAIYLLEVAEGDAVPARRVRLAGPQATLAIVAQSTNARLLGGEQQTEVLRRISEVVSRVPVYSLHVARDLSRIGYAARQLREWLHTESSAASSPDHAEPSRTRDAAWA